MGNNRIKRVARVGAWTDNLKNPTKCLWRLGPERRSIFFFCPSAHLCVVTYMTERKCIVWCIFHKEFKLYVHPFERYKLYKDRSSYASPKATENGAISRGKTVKSFVLCRCLDGKVKEPYGMSMVWEPDRRSNILFSPLAQLCAVTYILLKRSLESVARMSLYNQLQTHADSERIDRFRYNFQKIFPT